MTGVTIRNETTSDHDQISLVNEMAFRKKQEGELVVNLRKLAEFLPELSPFDTPDEAMMAIELKNGSLGFGGGTIDFPEVYYASL